MKPLWSAFFYDKTAARVFLRALFLMLGGTLLAKGIPALVPYSEWGILLMGLGGLIGAGQPNAAQPTEPKEG